MYGARPRGSGVVMASPPPCAHAGDACCLSRRMHRVQTHSPPIILTCFSHTQSPHSGLEHWAAGAEARAARPRFGPPQRGHSPAALLTCLRLGGEPGDELVLAARIRQLALPAHLLQ